MNFAGVFGTKSLAVGTDVGFDTATGKFVKYNAGVSYKDVDYTLSLTLWVFMFNPILMFVYSVILINSWIN